MMGPLFFFPSFLFLFSFARRKGDVRSPHRRKSACNRSLQVDDCTVNLFWCIRCPPWHLTVGDVWCLSEWLPRCSWNQRRIAIVQEDKGLAGQHILRYFQLDSFSTAMWCSRVGSLFWAETCILLTLLQEGRDQTNLGGNRCASASLGGVELRVWDSLSQSLKQIAPGFVPNSELRWGTSVV